ncbi:MAG: hypothetical protein ACE5Z5_06925 [Candidatus Bathyarchaeia archaeon]
MAVSEAGKRWITLRQIGRSIGGSRMTIVEETLNDYFREGRIASWKFVAPWYNVLTDRKDFDALEREVMYSIQEKFRSRRRG